MRLKFVVLAGILVLASCVPAVLRASGNATSRAPSAPAFVDVRLDAPAKLAHLKPGDKLQGKVTHNVFCGYRLVVPRGSQIHLTVSGIKRGPKIYNSVWPWPIRYFRPKYERLPNFDFADVTLSGGKKVHLQVWSVSAIKSSEVAAKHKSKIRPATKAGSSSRPAKGSNSRPCSPGLNLQLVVRAQHIEAPTFSAEGSERAESTAAPLSEIETVSAGSNVKLALLGTLSASKSREGDPFKALLVKPIRLDSGTLLPEGTVFEGHVTKSVPPRWLSRPGSLYIKFTRLVLPAEANLPIAASVAGVEASQRSQIKVNSEGGMSGGGPGKARLLLDLGVSAGISKVADDSYQLITELLVSSATDASTAGTARLIGFAVTGLYMLTRRGLDVTLPRYTTITVRFDRAPSLPSAKLVSQREIGH